jgi:methionine aminopeptidase
MVNELSLVHNKKKTEKGIAFPTCVSVNEVSGHNSPLEDDQVLKEGDLVKVDLGVHIDGYVGMGAHSVVVGTPSAKQSDLLVAGHTAL